MKKSGAANRTDSFMRIRSNWPRAATLLTAFGLFSATLLTWQIVRNTQDKHLAEQARERIEFLAARLDAHVKLRISLGALIEEEWRNGLVADAETFGSLASTKLNYFDALQAINWVDSDGVIRWVNPLAGNKAVLGLDLRQLRIPAQTLALSEQERNIKITPPITLAQGGRGFVAYMPLFTNNTLKGFVNIVFRTAPMITNALPKDFSARMHLRITDDGAEIFSSNAETIKAENAPRTTIQLQNRIWTLTGVLTAAETARLSSFRAEWILLAGLILNLFVSYLVWVAMQYHYSIQSGKRRFADFAGVSSDWFWETTQI